MSDKKEIHYMHIINLVRACIGKDPIPHTEAQKDKAPGAAVWGCSLAESARGTISPLYPGGRKAILGSNTELVNIYS